MNTDEFLSRKRETIIVTAPVLALGDEQKQKNRKWSK